MVSLIRRANRRRWEWALFTLLLAAIIVTSGYLHLRAGYTLPVPWQDESPFIWQAKAWADSDNLLAPEVNAERPIYWMPPLYFVALGTWFKFTGVTLESARWFSFILVVLSYVALALMLRQYRCPALTLAISAPFLVTAPWVAAGNVARMDALLLLFVLAAFYALILGRQFLALTIMALAPLVHPNGCYFALALAVHVVIQWTRERRWLTPNRPEMALVILVGVMWAGYIGWVIAHWEPFINDMTPQFSRKAERDIASKLLSPLNMMGLAALVAAAWYSHRRGLRLSPLITLTIPAWFVFAAGQEMWYYVFRSLSYALLTVIFTLVLIDLAGRFRGQLTRRAAPIWVWLFLFAAFWRAGKTEHIGPPPWEATKMNFQDMWISAEPYIAPASLDIVRHQVATLVADSGAAIQFDPRGDAFFYLDESRRLQFSDPFFAERRAQWHLIHVSSLQPPDLLEYRIKELEAAGVRYNDLDIHLVHQEGSTERWYLIRNRETARLATDSIQRLAPTMSQK